MDPMDWTHQWDNYEMMMYAQNEPEPGIYMQLSQQTVESGAVLWDLLYTRRIADLQADVAGEPGSESWEESQLKKFFSEHPQVVNQEKEYLQAWQRENGNQNI